MSYTPPKLQLPNGYTSVVLHACCAPCSSAILECMLESSIRPTVFYFNPNIYPKQEYELRKNESIRQVRSLGLDWVDGDYDHSLWSEHVKGLEQEPERGRRCSACFLLRMERTARLAKDMGIGLFTTTLASSRWKDIRQIDDAARRAAMMVGSVEYWAVNWRKGGLSERRNQLLKEGGFYNQQYCGCEYSMQAAIKARRRSDPGASSPQTGGAG